MLQFLLLVRVISQSEKEKTKQQKTEELVMLGAGSVYPGLETTLSLSSGQVFLHVLQHRVMMRERL